MLRRSRGYVAGTARRAGRFARPVLACGAELKSTFCLARDGHAFVSQHIGDLENAETLRSFTEGIEHFRRLFDIAPEVVAHDLHPEYLSTKYAADLADGEVAGAADLAGVELVGVQHHHAHIASCLADNRAAGPVIGVAFDGTGYGTDGTIWGGEFLIADLAGFERAGHLAPVPMPGGAAAIRQPWRMAAAYLDAAGCLDAAGGLRDGLDVARRNQQLWPGVLAMARRGVNSPVTSSAGRLFDAVAAILGVRDTINYEGQAAVELEQLADPAERGAYRAAIAADGPLRIAGRDLVRAVAEDLAAGTSRSVIAGRFHNGVAGLITECCLLLRERHGLGTVALSGGVFQNLLLLDATVRQLEAHGFGVLVHSRVPCNDGGISLGQAVVAAAAAFAGLPLPAEPERGYSRGRGAGWQSQSYHSGRPAPVVADSGSIRTPGLSFLTSAACRSRSKSTYGSRSVLVTRTRSAWRNMCGYFTGLSSPSVTDASTTLACSPRSNRAGQTRLPTFSITTTDPPGGSSARRPSATISASRWQPVPVLICTTRQPAERIRSASSAAA